MANMTILWTFSCRLLTNKHDLNHFTQVQSRFSHLYMAKTIVFSTRTSLLITNKHGLNHLLILHRSRPKQLPTPLHNQDGTGMKPHKHDSHPSRSWTPLNGQKETVRMPHHVYEQPFVTIPWWSSHLLRTLTWISFIHL